MLQWTENPIEPPTKYWANTLLDTLIVQCLQTHFRYLLTAFGTPLKCVPVHLQMYRRYHLKGYSHFDFDLLQKLCVSITFLCCFLPTDSFCWMRVPHANYHRLLTLFLFCSLFFVIRRKWNLQYFLLSLTKHMEYIPFALFFNYLFGILALTLYGYSSRRSTSNV